MTAIPAITDLPILLRRKIEAEFARGLYAEMVAEIGAEAARRILSNAIVKMAHESAAALAATAPGGKPDLDSFRATRGAWSAGDALRIEVQESTATDYNYNVVTCRYAEMYRDMGLAERGAILSCNRDGAYCGGYDPKLKLTRTQTIMEGASHCDFRYHRAPD